MNLKDIDNWDDLIDVWELITEQGTNLAAIRALCVEDLAYLLAIVCKRYDVMHPWLLQRIREFERSPDGHLDLWSREHYKSTIITFAGTIQELLKNPEEKIVIFSHTGGIAQKFLMQIKTELENNELLKKAFPDILYQDPNSEAPSGKWNLDSITVKRKGNPKEASIEAHGLVTGMPTSKHYSLLVYDDVVTMESVGTPEQIEKTTTAWELSLALGSEGDRKRYVGTRWHLADTYATMIERGGVKTRLYPATHDGTMDGNPVLFTKMTWDARKLNTSDQVLACQYLQDPLSGAEKMFDVKMVKFYEVRPFALRVYILCDPARSKKKGSDNTAYSVVGVDHDLNKYLLDGINHRCDLQERWEWLKLLYTKWKKMPGIQAVEVGYEKYGALADLDYFKEQQQRNKLHFDIKELAWPSEGGGSKGDRVGRLVPELKKGRLYLPYPTDPNKKIVDKDGKQIGTGNVTATQRRHANQDYLWSKKILKKDSEGVVYDLGKQLMQQIQYFPMGKVDLIDATSRIYDMGVRKPLMMSEHSLDPDD